MLFHSLDYILFLGLAVAVFWALARTPYLRYLWLFLMSALFYMVWNPVYISLILGSALIDWTVGQMIPKAQRAKKAWLALSVVTNLSVLGTFKYFNFFAASAHSALDFIGISVPPVYLDVLLPVGISFYTFQTMSYTIDVYRGTMKPVSNFLKYLVFLLYFPQLVAGPIVRASQLIPQLAARPALTKKMVGEGTFLIMKGLVKKVIFADLLAVNLVDRVFDNPSAFTSVEVMIGLYAYTLQIYSDFSGYTDVARGSARLMGIVLPENFMRPYMATSPADFWRRWHMTLSTWLKDYVYIPLGGSRGSPFRVYFNLWLTLFLIGIWHGAGWTFVVYGTIHGLAMVIHRYFYKKSGRTAATVDPRWLMAVKIFFTFHFTVLSRILFRSPSIDRAGDVAGQLFSGSISTAQINSGVWLLLLLGFLIHWSPQSMVLGVRNVYLRLPAVVQGVVMALVGVLLLELASTQVVPYIYFQF